MTLIGKAKILYPYNKKELKISFFRNLNTNLIISSPLNNMIKFIYYDISVLSSKAISKVNESIYSMSTPKGIPCAILLTLTF